MPCRFVQDSELGKAGNQCVGCHVRRAGDLPDLSDGGHRIEDHAVQHAEAVSNGVAQAGPDRLHVLVAECRGAPDLRDAPVGGFGDGAEEKEDPRLPGTGPLDRAQAFAVLDQAETESPGQRNHKTGRPVKDRQGDQAAGHRPQRRGKFRPAHGKTGPHDLGKPLVVELRPEHFAQDGPGRGRRGLAVLEDPDDPGEPFGRPGLAREGGQAAVHRPQASRRLHAPGGLRRRRSLHGQQVVQ